MKELIAILTLAALLGIGHPAFADAGVAVVFSEKEISIISAWYEDHRLGHGRRASKEKGLPPGIARNVSKGKPLPRGIAKQYFPTELNLMLPKR